MNDYGKRAPKEYSDRFDELRKNRSEMSFYKYGSAEVNFGMHLVDALATCDKCIRKYRETKNTEYLLDAANYLMFEFMYPSIEGASFRATGSDESAGIVGVDVNSILGDGTL